MIEKPPEQKDDDIKAMLLCAAIFGLLVGLGASKVSLGIAAAMLFAALMCGLDDIAKRLDCIIRKERDK